MSTLVTRDVGHPEIVFQSTDVTAKPVAPNQYDVKIRGNLTLHGELDLDRDDYDVKATSAKKGTIRVRDNVDFTFDIVAHRE